MALSAVRSLADLCVLNQRGLHLLAHALAPCIGQQHRQPLRRKIEREIDEASQDAKPAANPQEQAQGPLGMKPALEMRRGNQQLLCECVIANAEPRPAWLSWESLKG